MYPTLVHLPSTVIARVLKFLDPTSFTQAEKSCRSVFEVSRDDVLMAEHPCAAEIGIPNLPPTFLIKHRAALRLVRHAFKNSPDNPCVILEILGVLESKRLVENASSQLWQNEWPTNQRPVVRGDALLEGLMVAESNLVDFMKSWIGDFFNSNAGVYPELTAESFFNYVAKKLKLHIFPDSMHTLANEQWVTTLNTIARVPGIEARHRVVIRLSRAASIPKFKHQDLDELWTFLVALIAHLAHPRYQVVCTKPMLPWPDNDGFTFMKMIRNSAPIAKAMAPFDVDDNGLAVYPSFIVPGHIERAARALDVPVSKVYGGGGMGETWLYPEEIDDDDYRAKLDHIEAHLVGYKGLNDSSEDEWDEVCEGGLEGDWEDEGSEGANEEVRPSWKAIILKLCNRLTTCRVSESSDGEANEDSNAVLMGDSYWAVRVLIDGFDGKTAAQLAFLFDSESTSSILEMLRDEDSDYN